MTLSRDNAAQGLRRREPEGSAGWPPVGRTALCPAPAAKYFTDGEFPSFVRPCSAPEAAGGLHTAQPPLCTPSNEATPRDRRAWAWHNHLDITGTVW